MRNPRVFIVIGLLGVAVVLFLTLARERATDTNSAGLGPQPGLALERASAEVEQPALELAQALGPARTALAGDSTNAAEASATAASGGVSLAGSVIDTRSRPIAGAVVRLWVSGRAVIVTMSDDDGQFALEGVPPSDRAQIAGTVHALAPDGRVAAQVTYVPTSEAMNWRPPLELVVGPARTGSVRVVVEREGLPVPGADVELEAGFERALVGLARSKADGAVDFQGVPTGSLHARATFADGADVYCGAVNAPSDHPSGSPLRITLTLARDLTVVVREKGTELPLVGIQVDVQRSVMPPRTFSRGGDLWLPQERHVPGVAAQTDDAGRALLRGLPRESLIVRAEVAADDRFNGAPTRRARADDTEVTIEVTRHATRPRVSWPIVAGELPAPASGTRVTVVVEPGRMQPGAVEREREGIMVGTNLVVEGVPDTHVGFLAKTDDGAIARLFAAPATELGNEASFRRARTITVRVRDHRGEPLAGHVVTAANQGNNPLAAPVETGADGVAVISGLYGGLANVSVAPAGLPSGREEAGAIDLEQGDGVLDYEAPEALRATLRISVDGAPGMPPALRVWPLRIESKDPRTSLVTVVFRLAGDATELAASVSAPGYSPTQFVLTRALCVPGAPPLDVEMSRSGALLLEVLRADGTDVALVPERQAEDGQWKKESPFEHQYPNADDGRFLFDSLAAGRYRIRDAKSGAATEGIDVDPALGEARATLDLTRHGLAQGVIFGPDGFNLSTARVIVEGADIMVADNAWQVVPGAPKGSIAVGHDGSFSLPVSLDRSVVLRAWHPVLAPAADSGELRIVGPRDGIRLQLVEGPTCAWTMPAGFKGTLRTAVRVLLYRDHAREQLVSEHVAERNEGSARFGGFEPGTYTLWIDLSTQFAPLVLRDVALGGGHTDLGGIPFTADSAVRVVLRPQTGGSPPRIYVSAFSIDTAPDGSSLYNRQLNSRGEAEVILAGLGAGKFNVHVGSIGAGELVPKRVIELDGVRDEVIEIDL